MSDIFEGDALPFYAVQRLEYPACDQDQCRVSARWIVRGDIVPNAVMLLCPGHKRAADRGAHSAATELLTQMRELGLTA